MQRPLVSLISLVRVCAGCYQRLDEGEVISDASRVESGGPAWPVSVHLCSVVEEEPDQVQAAPEGGEAERINAILFLDRRFCARKGGRTRRGSLSTFPSMHAPLPPLPRYGTNRPGAGCPSYVLLRSTWYQLVRAIKSPLCQVIRQIYWGCRVLVHPLTGGIAPAYAGSGYPSYLTGVSEREGGGFMLEQCHLRAI